MSGAEEESAKLGTDNGMGCEMGGIVRRLCESVAEERAPSVMGEGERERGVLWRTPRERKRRLGTRLRTVDELDDEDEEEAGTRRPPRRAKCSI